MLHNKRRKSKGEKQFISKIYMQEMMQLTELLARVARAPEFYSRKQKNREGPRRPSLQAGDKMIPSQPSFE